MKEAETKIQLTTDNAGYIYLPATITTDSSFPFERKPQDVIIKIVGEKLVIEKK